MIDFDFITDDRFRASLIADYAEFQTSVSGEAWKASLVLAGSIVEALLVDHLIAAEYQTRSGRDPLKMHLAELIAACEKDKVLSANTTALSIVIKNYRNLIHPGRSVRLGESTSKSAAIVAGELLQMIVEEVSANRSAKYGLTADQIVKKLERDESAMSIHKHLLKDVAGFEIERLLMKVIPKRYFELDSAMGEFGPEPDVIRQERLATCFRSAFDLATDETKKKVTARFVSVLKEEDQRIVLAYEEAFFRASDLQYIGRPDAKLVKDHLLSRIHKDVSLRLLDAMEGLPSFLDPRDISDLVDSLLRTSLSRGPNLVKTRARTYLAELWRGLPGGEGGLDHKVLRRLDDWIAHFEKQGNMDSANIVREIKEEVGDIPF